MEKLIITAAICGAEVTKQHNSAVPYTVEEMVREAKRSSPCHQPATFALRASIHACYSLLLKSIYSIEGVLSIIYFAKKLSHNFSFFLSQ